jgi:hypothetical protein
MAQGTRRLTFAVPVTSGQYAPEVLYCALANVATAQSAGGVVSEPRRGGMQFLEAPLDTVREISVMVESLVTASAVELDLLKPGGDPTVAGDWILAAKSWAAVGLQLQLLADWPGVRLRVKSGGTVGTTIVSAVWR